MRAGSGAGIPLAGLRDREGLERTGRADDGRDRRVREGDATCGVSGTVACVEEPPVSGSGSIVRWASPSRRPRNDDDACNPLPSTARTTQHKTRLVRQALSNTTDPTHTNTTHAAVSARTHTHTGNTHLLFVGVEAVNPKASKLACSARSAA